MHEKLLLHDEGWQELSVKPIRDSNDDGTILYHINKNKREEHAH